MMSPLTPYWVPALGAAFAIVVVKMPFGGTGRNVFNPAAAGMAVVTHCFSTRAVPLSGSLSKRASRPERRFGKGPDRDVPGGPAGRRRLPNLQLGELAIGRFPGPIGATCIAVLAALRAVSVHSTHRLPSHHPVFSGCLRLVGHPVSPAEGRPPGSRA